MNQPPDELSQTQREDDSPDPAMQWTAPAVPQYSPAPSTQPPYAQPYAPAPAWVPNGAGLQPSYSVLPGAMLPKRPASRRRLPAVLLILFAVAAVVCALLTASAYNNARSPGSVAQRYFAAVAAGHASVALALASTPPRGPFLTDTVLAEQLKLARLDDIRVRDVTTNGDLSSAEVSYRLKFTSGPKLVTDKVSMVKNGSKWRVAQAAVQISLDVVTVGGDDRVSLAGGKLPDDSFLIFPGALPVDTDSAALKIDGQPSVSLNDEQQPIRLSVQLTSAAQDSLRSSVLKALSACVQGKLADPNCPQASESRPVPGSLRGTVMSKSKPTFSLASSGGGRIAIDGSAVVKGRWQFWDFNNQAVTKTGTTTLDLHGSASLSDLGTVYWTQP
jgi:hypothetical protein